MGSTGVHRGPQGSTGVHRGLQWSTGVHRGIQGSTRVYSTGVYMGPQWSTVHGSTRVYRGPQYMGPQGSTRVHSTGVYRGSYLVSSNQRLELLVSIGFLRSEGFSTAIMKESNHIPTTKIPTKRKTAGIWCHSLMYSCNLTLF